MHKSASITKTTVFKSLNSLFLLEYVEVFSTGTAGCQCRLHSQSFIA